VALVNQKFLISLTNFAVIGAHNSSNEVAKTLFKAHFPTVSLIKPSPSGTISLKSSLPKQVSTIFELILTLIADLIVIHPAS